MTNKPLSMHTHKQILKPLLVALCVLALCLPFIFSNTKQRNSPAATKATYQVSAQKANPASAEILQVPDTPDGRALQHGLNYLQGRVTKIPPFERLLLGYLQRKYGINQVFSASKTPIKSPTRDQQEDPVQYRAYQRIAYSDSLVKSLPPAPDDEMSEMMLAAANCDHIPLLANFGDVVNQNIQGGQYSLTHVAFAIRLLEDNRCTYFTPQQIEDIKNQVSDGMVQLASSSATMADLRYEAMTFLFEVGQGSRVQQSWVDQMVTKQLPNGSWSQSGGDSVPRDHTTLLAIWTLLAQNNPTAPNEPMIRRPN